MAFGESPSDRGIPDGAVIVVPTPTRAVCGGSSRIEFSDAGGLRRDTIGSLYWGRDLIRVRFSGQPELLVEWEREQRGRGAQAGAETG